MALERNEQQVTRPAGSNAMQRAELKPAEGWANISLVDATGKEHRIKAGIPLYKDQDRVPKALLERMEQIQKQAAAGGQPVPTQMKVHMVAVISLAEPQQEINWTLPAEEGAEEAAE